MFFIFKLMKLVMAFSLILSFSCLSFAITESELVDKAHRLNLSSQEYWRILLYYKKNHSIISSKNFFLAEDGMTNPQAELDATIKSLFLPPFNDKSVLCRFPARIKWLKKELSLTDSDIPPADCKELKKHLKYLNPRSISLLFTNQSFISPQSMFGHVALKINRDNSDNIQSNGHVISYMASIGEEDLGPVKLIKGAFGKFKGHFVLSGFDEYRENYNTFENRDIWEYSLNLSTDEIETLMYRIWELKYIDANYYFFSINCASIIEYWIRSARPDVKLNNRLWTTPMDVIHNAYKSGLLQSMTFYPSEVRKYKAIMSSLDEKKRMEVYKIVHGDSNLNRIVANYMEQDVAKIIAAARIKNLIDFLNGEISEKKYLDNLDKFKKNTITTSPINNIKMPLPYNPVNAHNINRLEIIKGYNVHGGYSSIKYSPLYHDISDNPMGYPKNTNLRFFSSKITYYHSDNQLGVEVDLINVASFVPINDYIKELSFMIDLRFRSDFKYTAPKNRENEFYLSGAKGITWSFSENINYFGMLKLIAEATNQRKKHYYVGTGVKSGFIISNQTFFSTIVEFDYDYGYEGFYSNNSCVKLIQSFFVTRNLSLKMIGEYNLKYGKSDESIGVTLYF